MYCVFFFKQKTAYEMRISDWSSDVCSSDLTSCIAPGRSSPTFARSPKGCDVDTWKFRPQRLITASLSGSKPQRNGSTTRWGCSRAASGMDTDIGVASSRTRHESKYRRDNRSEEHTSEIQTLMRISYAVLCLKQK